MADDTLAKFIKLGLSEQKSKETIKNVNVTKNLLTALEGVDLSKLPEGAGMLLYQLAAKIKPQVVDRISFIAPYVVTQKLDTVQRVDSALEYVLTLAQKKEATVNAADFEKFCGVGIVVGPEEIERVIESYVRKHKEDIVKQRYRFNVGKIMLDSKGELKWADGKAVKNEIDVQLFKLLGPKTEQDLAPPPKLEKKPKEEDPKKLAAAKNPKVAADECAEDGAQSIAELMKTKVNFHKPGDNFKTNGYVVTDKTEQLLREHLKATGGRVQTRFPPEPNGILHIGHAKAININFGYAAAHNGTCNLRYDDTNPEKEEEKFFIGIRDMVEWLGYRPDAITYSSDNFQQLYDWAVVLIRKGLAYVCHQAVEDMRGFNPIPSPWRDRPIAQSLRLFEDMKSGKIDEGAATLRLKITLEEGKMDPVAYRIKFIAHHRTDKWCIYPTYDYTHCLCDSIENITHSLCTKEFQSRRSSYYWLCNALDIYCPVQWEYSRLNVNYTVVSKRKIAKLITEKIVQDWDDPRLFTLSALRRRGFPAEAINNFCAQMGVTGAQATVDPAMLEASVRDVLNVTAARTFAVLEPLKVTIVNYPETRPTQLTVATFPSNPEKGNHTISFDRVVYIERTDFERQPDKGFRRLTKDQAVGLKHANVVIKLKEVVEDGQGGVKELICEQESVETAAKPKAFIHFVANPLEVEVRLYQPLFFHKNPEDTSTVPNGFLSDVNINSKKVLRSYVDAHMKDVKSLEQFQFERMGYFSVDPDTAAGRIVFNRTVTLKEEAGKNSYVF